MGGRNKEKHREHRRELERQKQEIAKRLVPESTVGMHDMFKGSQSCGEGVFARADHPGLTVMSEEDGGRLNRIHFGENTLFCIITEAIDNEITTTQRLSQALEIPQANQSPGTSLLTLVTELRDQLQHEWKASILTGTASATITHLNALIQNPRLLTPQTS